MARYSFGESTTVVEVDFFGRSYELRPVTKTVSANLDALDEANRERYGEKQLADLEDGEQIAFFGRLLDVLLKPVGGQRKLPSAVLSEAWDADKVEIDPLAEWVFGLRRGPGDDGEAGGRPN